MPEIIPLSTSKTAACVRLAQGLDDDATVIFPMILWPMAAKWVNGGCRRLHLVETLNGALRASRSMVMCYRDRPRAYAEPAHSDSVAASARWIHRALCARWCQLRDLWAPRQWKRPESSSLKPAAHSPARSSSALTPKMAFVPTDGGAEVSNVQVIDPGQNVLRRPNGVARLSTRYCQGPA